MAVVYRSTVTQNAFYIAFEDLPTAPDNFRLPTSRGYANDGDFNDFVYFVEGATCEGGGLPCLGSAEGACGFGLTECLPDGTTVCVPQLQESDEVCDNIDNDCDGLVDEGDLCRTGEVCDKGVCRPNCSGGEFPCDSNLVCNADGLCVDPACLDVVCEAGQVCLGGACVGGCSNVVCPWGQECQLGRCVDPCASRTCPEDTVCERGVCVQTCQCRMCGPGLECDDQTGACVPPGCRVEDNVVCAANEVCLAGANGDGACINRCSNVLCPGGAACNLTTGACDPPFGVVPTPVDYELHMQSDGGVIRQWSDGGVEVVEIQPDGTIVVVDPDESGGDESTSGCNCRASRSGSSAWAALGLALLGFGIRRRRRSRR